MLSGLDGGCVVAILPKSPLSLFPIVDFLTSSSRNKLNEFRNFRYFRTQKDIIALF
jgi:hypothetical protein